MNAVVQNISPPPLAGPFIQARKLTPFVGSEITGVNLKQVPSEATIASIRSVLLERGVVFIPGQHLTPAEHVAVASRFGEVKIGAESKPDSPHPGIRVLDSRDEIYGRVSRWHSDLTSAERPPSISINNIITLPELGGDTLWASTEAAYARLAEPLQRLAESLTAVHAITPIKASEWGKGGTPFHWAEHPVVRVHPETGRKSLFVNPRYTPEIVGLRPHESAAVLKVFFDHILQPEHTVRYRWSVGTLVLWDNRSTVHYAIDDYDDALRIVHHVSLAGDRPVGVAP
jgi:alpha-ketoglutarate-dependent taurine dioxygenase